MAVKDDLNERIKKAAGGGGKPKLSAVSKKTGALRNLAGKAWTGTKFASKAALPVTALSAVTEIPPVKAGLDKGIRAFNESSRNGLGAVDEGVDAYLKGARDYMFGGSNDIPNTLEQDAESNVAPIPEDERPQTFEQDVAGTTPTSVRMGNVPSPELTPYASGLPAVAQDPQLMEEGAEVQAPTSPESQGIRSSQIDYASDNPLQPGDTGQVRSYSGEDALNDPQAKALARQAASGEINTSQYNAGLRSIRQAQEQQTQGGSASQLADSISKIERELRSPGRGANQSLNDMLTEARVRKNKRRALDELYSLQKNENTNQTARDRTEQAAQSKAADRTSRERIASQKTIAARNKEARAASVRTEQEAYTRRKDERDFKFDVAKETLSRTDATNKEKASAMKDATVTYKEDSKTRFPDDPARQNMYVADMQMSHVKPGDPYFTSPQGRTARKDASRQLHKYFSNERGLIDFFANIPGMIGFTEDDRPTQADIEDMDFSNFNVDDSGEGAYFLRSAIRSTKPGQEAYAYKHSMSPEFASVMRKLIANDRVKKNKAGVRASQEKRQRDTQEYMRSI